MYKKIHSLEYCLFGLYLIHTYFELKIIVEYLYNQK